ncbi:MAG TPA: sugar phosphate isomerase/epimerase family protein [Ktedonobacteraceae bacterium]|nr:sugar phosphate isomerase/epimerase family protein [Ktedonobacteraceae bacterium]
MKLGFLTGNISDIEKAAQLGFDAVELSADAFGNAMQGELNTERIVEAKTQSEKHGVAITALAYYRLAAGASSIDAVTTAYERVFAAAAALGVHTIASMGGFDASLDWKGNIQLFADRFGPVAQRAEQHGMRVAVENWMGFGGRVPFKPVNIGGSPDTWDDMFNAVPSPALGLEFDPSHLYWQGIDHLRALREYKDRVYHVHAKDTEMLPERRYRGGINGDYFRFRIPGYGEINWTAFISALNEIGYDSSVAIEHEDPIYSGERFDEGLVRGRQVLYPLIHPGQQPNHESAFMKDQRVGSRQS